MIRRRIAMLFVPTLLILAVAGAFAWLLHTESGARWILQRVAAMTPGQLVFRQPVGDLRSGLRIPSLTYRNDNLSAEIEDLALALSFDFWPPALSVHNLEAGQLSLRSQPGPKSAGEVAPAERLSRFSLPFPVTFERIAIHRLNGSGAAAELEVRGLELSAHWFRSLKIDSLHATCGESQWTADLAVDFQAPFALKVDAQATVLAPDTWGLRQPLVFEAHGDGDLALSRWDLRIIDPSVSISGKLSDLLGAPAWDLQLAADSLQWPLAAAEPAVTLDAVLAGSYGSFEDYGIEAEARASGRKLPGANIRLLGTGDATGLDFEALSASGDDLDMKGTGRFAWQKAVGARFTVEVSRFDPAAWIPAWGDAEPLSGNLAAAWADGRVEFELGEVQAPGTVAAITGSGRLDPAAGTVAADLEWEGFAWPPGGAAEPVVFSRDGHAVLGGKLDDWTVGGELELSGPDFPAGRLQVRGGGNRASLHLVVPTGAVLGGTIAGEFETAWSPEVSWAATAKLTGLSTAPLAPDFPGRISGEVSVRGRPEPRALEIDIRNLSGVVRERQVQASGRLAIDAGRIRATDLRLRSGQSRVTLDGHPNLPDGLAFSARIESLSDLVDGATGSFTGNGEFSPDPGHPRLRLDGEGRDLSWGGYAVSAISVSTAPGDDAKIQLELNGIDFADSRIESLNILTDGDRPMDGLSAWADFGDSRAELRLDGRVQDWADPLGAGWTGRVSALRWEGEAFGFVQLEKPVALQLNDTAFVLDPACFTGSRAGRLCLKSTWRPSGERTLEAALEDVSPNLAMRLLDSELAFSQRVSGELTWQQLPRGKPKARVDLRISAGRITAQAEDESILETGPGLFGFELADGRLYAGNLDIPVPGAGGIDTDFSVPDLSAGLASQVQGQIRINLNNIQPILRLLPGFEGSSGPVTADLKLSGTVADPQLTGHASLVRGSISHFATGLSLEDIRLAGAVYRYDQTELRGTFRAGNGEGDILAVLNFDDILKPELRVEIKGENLTLVNVPSLNVTANPDIRAVWRQGELTLDGRLAVPSARISPLFLPTAAASESADFVVVAGQDSLAEQEGDRSGDWRLHGKLELELGDDVQVALERAKAQLRGKAQFSWDGRMIPVADGSLLLSGEILAYGQLLKVTEGRINFSNRPADNPFLNIRAEREIYGNPQITRAGVLVTGTLKEPILEPYSVPMTTRERALTLLVTGSDFNYEQGVGSVEVGMYVAPKLFISYGIGLFEDQNVVSARYDLGKGFGIKTTSGQRETGADISYTIER